ncbi:hypothetical protein ElyMa_005991900 [Elysia marginata]|uniref:Uncharacterized protein n=1 Tax=Elysia marginata TaxID=1093978 RepID=A0AAV4GGT6_9GAST|nr:hypothetical protein ElyMa_005991900 [Elysia marginata]
MSCNYYRVMPEPPRPEVYGFKKVTQEELGNIISRLSKPTYNSRVHTVEAHKAHNYRRIHSAPPPRTPTQCSRRRFSTPTAAPNSTITTNNINSTKANNNENAHSTPSPNPPNTDGVEKSAEVGENLKTDDVDNPNTENDIKENDEANNNDLFDENEEEDEDGENNASELTTPAPLLPSPTPPAPVPLSQRKMTEIELRRFLRRIQRPTRAYVRSRRDYIREEDDEIMAGDDFTSFNAAGERTRRPLTATERKKAFFLMSRPTTASKAKSLDGSFYPVDEEELKANRNVDLPFKYPHAPEVRLVTSGEASSIVSRVSSPTRASLRGTGPPCYRSTPDYDAVRVQHPSLPLVSGLARTPKVSQIVNRLHYGTPKRIVIVLREEEEEEMGRSEQSNSIDRRGSRGMSSEDERGRSTEGVRCVRYQHRRHRPTTSRMQAQNSHRSYHGYQTSATPITAWT